MPPPIKRFSAGNMTASVFANEITVGEQRAILKTVTLQRSYRDKEGIWQHTTGGLRANDIPRAVLVLTQAYTYMVARDVQEHSSTRTDDRA